MPIRLVHIIAAFAVTLPIFFTSIGCKKQTHENPARGTLYTIDGSCNFSYPQRTYFTGIADDSNYVSAYVHVSSPGSYTITSDRQNGVVFSASGTFTDTGRTSVKLRANGTFIKPVLTYFNLTFDTTLCQFFVPVEDSTGLSMAPNSWKFTANGRTYQGTGTAVWYELPALGDKYRWYGSMSGFTDTSLNIQFVVFYDTAGGANPTYFIDNNFDFKSSRFDSTEEVHFFANYQTPNAVIYIRRINDYVLTFNGMAMDANNNIVSITDAWWREAGHRFVNEE